MQAIVHYDDVAQTEPQIYEDVHLQVLANLKEDCDVLPFLHLDKWFQLFPYLDPCIRIRLLGGLGKRILSLDRLFHAELRQSVEAYLAFILHTIAYGNCHYRTLSVSELLRTVGIRLEQGHPECGFLEVIDIDHHATKGFEPTHFAITDRWGMYREFNEDGTQLHARVCYHMRKAGGCKRYLDFHDCGCACPYMHARSSELG